MLIELKDNFRGKKPGDVIDWPEPMARILIDQKRAVAFDPGKTIRLSQGKAVDAPPVDKMQRKVKGK